LQKQYCVIVANNQF